MGSYVDICPGNATGANRVAAHYNVLAKNYDYFYKERHEAQFKILMKYLDLKSDHLVVDLASGTGVHGEKLVDSFKLKSPVWCVEPSSEMQKVAKGKKGVLTIEKTVEEFLDDLDKQHRFDFALCVGSVHHFSDPVKVYKGVELCLTPDGVFMVVQVGELVSFPLFKKAKNRLTSFVSDRKECSSAYLRSANFEVEVSEERLVFVVKKYKWYDMLRGRFHSTLRELSDEEIEEGIDELNKGILQHAKGDDDIPISMNLFIFIAKKM